MHKDRRKRGISEIVGYVLLISIAVVLSLIAYNAMKTLVPKETATCPADLSLSINSYLCDDKMKVLYVDLENKGLFNVDAFKIEGSSNGGDVATEPIGDGNAGKGFYSFMQPLKSGDSEQKKIIFTQNTINFLSLTPARFESGKNILCSDSAVKQKIVCNFDSTLLSWLKFDGSLRDSTPYHNDGNCNATQNSCPLLVNGLIGSGAYQFNLGKYINISRKTEMQVENNSFSVSVWVKKDIIPNGLEYILDSGTSQGYNIFVGVGGLTSVGVKNRACNIFDNSWIGDGNKHNFILSADRSTDQLFVYKDGGSACSFSGLTGNYSSNSDIVIGSSVANALQDNFNGTIDDVRFYGKALSSSEANEIYTNGRI